MKKYLRLPFLIRIIISIILLQTLYFKFSGTAESKYTFSQIGMEPFGRIGSGIVELIAVILLFIPTVSWLGALLAAGTMAGAIFFHITSLGIEVQNDGGLLFILACIVFIGSNYLLLTERKNNTLFKQLYKSSK